MRYRILIGLKRIFELSPEEILREHPLLIIGLVMFIAGLLLMDINETLFVIIASIGFVMVIHELYRTKPKKAKRK